MYKTTTEDFEFFKQEFLRWSIILGVKNWEFDFRHKKADSEKDYRACIIAQSSDRLVTIYFYSDWGNKPDKKEISLVAFHEIWEVIFYDIRDLFSLDTIEDVADKEVHKIIRMLENVLFDKYYIEQ